MKGKTMNMTTRKSILLGVVCGLAFWPWLVLILPLALVFTPCQWIGHSLGYSSNLLIVLLRVVDIAGSYLFCVVIVYLITLLMFKRVS